MCGGWVQRRQIVSLRFVGNPVFLDVCLDRSCCTGGDHIVQTDAQFVLFCHIQLLPSLNSSIAPTKMKYPSSLCGLRFLKTSLGCWVSLALCVLENRCSMSFTVC